MEEEVEKVLLGITDSVRNQVSVLQEVVSNYPGGKTTVELETEELIVCYTFTYKGHEFSSYAPTPDGLSIYSLSSDCSAEDLCELDEIVEYLNSSVYKITDAGIDISNALCSFEDFGMERDEVLDSFLNASITDKCHALGMTQREVYTAFNELHSDELDELDDLMEDFNDNED